MTSPQEDTTHVRQSVLAAYTSGLPRKVSIIFFAALRNRLNAGGSHRSTGSKSDLLETRRRCSGVHSGPSREEVVTGTLNLPPPYCEEVTREGARAGILGTRPVRRAIEVRQASSNNKYDPSVGLVPRCGI
jgi:hypothetical protein